VNGDRLDGVGFFVDDSKLNSFDGKSLRAPDIYNGEFALCDPKTHLEYVDTQRCQGGRELSSSYKFTQSML
jgi:hypothetical protein